MRRLDLVVPGSAMKQKRRKSKIGRNADCPCGSGKKYKRCCGNPVSTSNPECDAKERQFRQLEAAEKQRQDQQGLGKPIITETLQGHRLVAVGGQLYHSSKWKTFHDFLFDYAKFLLGERWGTEELQKPSCNRHPILNWYHDATVYLNSYVEKKGKVAFAPLIGCAAAYLRLAYNLYLLSHNAEIQNALIRRLKNKTQFYPAYYETFVAAALINAGFQIEFENESDSSTTHCEFTATHERSGKKFSVEAKRREPYKKNADVGNQLYAALKKKADYDRIVFIEINLPNAQGEKAVQETVSESIASIRKKEGSLKINGVLAPSAYVIVTNDPYQYSLDAEVKRWAYAEGFKIPDLKQDKAFSSIRETVDSRDRHVEVYDLMDSLATHDHVPSTFNGENPAIAFTGDPNSFGLIVGNTYAIPDSEGKEVIGELIDVAVVESRQLAVCILKTVGGGNLVAEYTMTDEEIEAYRTHPSTFFGQVKPTTQCQDFLEFYDRTLSIYSKSSKEDLLKLMAGASNFEPLKTLDQPELAKLYAEHVVESVARLNQKQTRKEE